MFAAIREIYNIPRDENRKLRDYPTLAHVIRFVYEKRPDLGRRKSQAPRNCAKRPRPQLLWSTVTTVTDDSIKDKVLEIVAEKTGYPKDMLDLDLDLEADLGIDTVKQAEMFAAIRAAYNIPRDENLKLREFPTLAHVIQFAHDRQTRWQQPLRLFPRSGCSFSGCDAGCTPATAVRELRCGEPNSAPRAGAQPAPAAESVQADRSDVGSRQPRGGHARQRRSGGSTDPAAANERV